MHVTYLPLGKERERDIWLLFNHSVDANLLWKVWTWYVRHRYGYKRSSCIHIYDLRPIEWRNRNNEETNMWSNLYLSVVVLFKQIGGNWIYIQFRGFNPFNQGSIRKKKKPAFWNLKLFPSYSTPKLWILARRGKVDLPGANHVLEGIALPSIHTMLKYLPGISHGRII